MDFSSGYYNRISDLLRRARETVDSYTPGPMTAASLVSPLPYAPANVFGAAAQHGAVPTSLVLNNHTPPLSPIGRINQGFTGFQTPPPASLPGIPMTGGPTDAGANARVAQGFEPFSPYGLGQAPQAPAAAAPAPAPAVAQAPQVIPTPAPRPDAAPPLTMTQTAGPSLIDKMLTYLHRKQDGGPSFTADASTFGGDTARDAYNS